MRLQFFTVCCLAVVQFKVSFFTSLSRKAPAGVVQPNWEKNRQFEIWLVSKCRKITHCWGNVSTVPLHRQRDIRRSITLQVHAGNKVLQTVRFPSFAAVCVRRRRFTTVLTTPNNPKRDACVLARPCCVLICPPALPGRDITHSVAVAEKEALLVCRWGKRSSC